MSLGSKMTTGSGSRIAAAVLAEAVAQPRRCTEDAAGTADVLAHDHHVLVARELDVEGVVDCLDHQQLSQASPPGCSAAAGHRRARTGAPDSLRPPPQRQRF